jgi:hypothetical protein
MEVNYDNPIFIYYINTTYVSPFEVERLSGYIKDQFTNFQLIILPNNEKTNMEVLWKGKFENSDDKEIIKSKIEDILFLIDSHITDETLKIKIRELILKQLE